jgi:hypothetical protein
MPLVIVVPSSIGRTSVRTVATTIAEATARTVVTTNLIGSGEALNLGEVSIDPSSAR